MPVVPCASVAVVKGIVVFDPTIFKGLFPAFTTVPDAALQEYFTWATIQLNNSCRSRVMDANQRETLLNLLVAHLATLFAGANGQPPAGIVGRVNTATEGSVSVGAEYASNIPQSMAFYVQTQYGALYWQLTSRYRTMQYRPAPCDVGYPSQFGPGFGGPWNGGCY